MAITKTGLSQIALKAETSETPEVIRDRMIKAHMPFIERAGAPTRMPI